MTPMVPTTTDSRDAGSSESATSAEIPSHGSRLPRAVECAAIMVGLPLVMKSGVIPVSWLFPVLWTAAVACLIALLRDPGFDRASFGRFDAVRSALPFILIRFGLISLVIVIGVGVLRPDLFFLLPRSKTTLWAIIMVAYPVFSVYPQGIIYRAFFMRRYGMLFRSDLAMIIASAAAFGFAHMIFDHWLTVVFTLAGGLMFAHTQIRTQSQVASAIEHALYGCLMFTIGLGAFFYIGGAGAR